LSFVCEGRNQNATGFNLGIDTIILSKIGRVEVIGGERAEEVRRAVRLAHPESVAAPALTDRDSAMREAAAWVFTQSAGAGRASTAALAKGLSDPDAVVRGLIARAVRSCTCGASMLPELGEALADPDENVRTATDDVVASAGVRALPLLPLLTNRSGRTIMFTFSGASPWHWEILARKLLRPYRV